MTRVPLVSTDDGVVPTDSPKTAPHEDPDGVLPPRTLRLRPPKDLPPGTTRVADYDRTPHSTERLFAYAGDTLSLFERPIDAAARATGPWRTILLPTLPDGDQIHDVWLVNDDALAPRVAEGHDERRAASHEDAAGEEGVDLPAPALHRLRTVRGGSRARQAARRLRSPSRRAGSRES